MLHKQARKVSQEAASEMSAASKPLSHAETTRFVLRESELSAQPFFLHNSPSAPCGRDQTVFFKKKSLPENLSCSEVSSLWSVVHHLLQR